MCSETPDSGRAVKRDSLWVLDVGSSNHTAAGAGPTFRTHPNFADARPWRRAYAKGRDIRY